jgi:HAD superfamily hydrolase (TIGR01549 family)
VSESASKTVLGDAGPVLLDFDGPVCSIFAGLPARDVASRLRRFLLAAGVTLPSHIEAEADPMEVLRFSATVEPAELVGRVDDELRAAELAAVSVATPTEGGAEFIKALRRDGRPVVIVSNNSSPAIHAYLDAHALADDIEHVIGRRYGQPQLMKPSPEPIQDALRQLGLDAATAVLIGDSASDVEAARAAGVRCIGFADRGYRYDRLTEAGADAVIKSMFELI